MELPSSSKSVSDETLSLSMDRSMEVKSVNNGCNFGLSVCAKEE